LSSITVGPIGGPSAASGDPEVRSTESTMR
jgi:hypothetical protein